MITFYFMAKELKNWNTESRTNLNLYDSKSYYYITTSNRGRFKIMHNLQATVQFKLTDLMIISFMVDLVNISRLGEQWFGESFDFKSEQELFQISILLTPLKNQCNIGCSGIHSTSFTITTNDQSSSNVVVAAIPPNSEINFNVLLCTKQPQQ
jgi:hypothetical protein